MVVLTLPRSVFINAIECGLERAGENFTADERARFQDFARTARSCGTNYSTGCPASAVLHFNPLGSTPPGVRAFAHGFDTVWCQRVVDPFKIPSRIRIVEDLPA